MTCHIKPLKPIVAQIATWQGKNVFQNVSNFVIKKHGKLHMRYSSGDMERDNFLSFWAIFTLLLTVTTQMTKTLKK